MATPEGAVELPEPPPVEAPGFGSILKVAFLDPV